MSILDDLVTRGRALLGRPKRPAPTNTQAVNSHVYDVQDWQAVAGTPMMSKLTAALTEDGFAQAPEMLQDLHGLLNKIDPRVHDADTMADDFKLNREVADQMLHLPEVQNLRQQTVGDPYATAFAMQSVAQTVVDTLGRANAMQQEALEQQAEAEKQAEAASQALQEALDGAESGDGAEVDPAAIEALFDAAQAAIDAAEDAAVEADNARSRGARATKATLAQAADAADAALAEELALMAAFGTEPGDAKRMSAEERAKLAERLRSNRLAAFVKLLGQFKQVQRAESRKRIIHAASEVHGVTHGDDWTRVLAGEMLNFADPTLELLMLKRWADRALLVHEVRGKENLGQGPIIFVGDESSSMTSGRVTGGTREAWSKALALAMLEQAKHRKRDFIYIGFANADHQRIVRFPQGEVTTPKVLEMTEGFLGGGTHYERPLAMALTEIENYANAGKPRPDIVFVTDDAYTRIPDPFMERWRKVKASASIKCYGISVAVQSSGALEQLCDSVRDVDEMVNDNPSDVGELFRLI